MAVNLYFCSSGGLINITHWLYRIVTK